MPVYAKYNEYQQVKLKQDRASVSEHPFTQLDVPRAVTTADHGTTVEVLGNGAVYIVEFFDAEDRTVDLLDLTGDEIEPYDPSA